MIPLSIPFRGGLSLAATANFPAGSDRPLLVLAHGSTTGRNLPLLVDLAAALALHNLNCLRFDFPFIVQGKRTPNSDSVLVEAFAAVLRETTRLYPAAPLFAGGKSLGARIAALTAVRARGMSPRGLVFLGYPLHPPGTPGESGGKAAQACPAPMLFVQGTRDAFANAAIMKKFCGRLARATLTEVAGGDHSLRGTADHGQVIAGVAAAIAAWIGRH